MSEFNLKIPAHDGDAFEAYMATPAITPAPVIIVIQEIFGVNAELRAKCDRLAEMGYIAIAPDLFWRMERGVDLVDSDEKQLEKAFQLFNDFDIEHGIEDLKTTLGYARNHKACNEKVGCIGYCLGGYLSVALNVKTDIDAAISYYGVNLPSLLEDTSKITKPLLLHIAGEDEFVPKDDQQAINDALKDHPHTSLHTYDGMDHAFARGQGMHYNEDAAKLANQRTYDFLSTHLKTAA